MDLPHWERGYRVHGYWLGMVRVGWVSLPPGRVAEYGYGWGVNHPSGRFAEGRAPTLKEAKKLVETAYQAPKFVEE